MDNEEKQYFREVPYPMQRLIEQVGFPDYDHADLEEDEARVYDLMKHGRCMTCEKPLRQHTALVIARPGIVHAFCSGMCMSDMAVLGFLQETHEDINDKIKLRNLAMPQADATPEDEKPDEAGDPEE